ncbi:unnamed protein product [Mucor hiemalis]
MKMHVFEVPSKQQQVDDPLYQIRTTIAAFNEHMVKCIIPAKYLVIDESMNQWLGTGMPNLKKIDTVSDPKPKEYDNEEGMAKLTATVKRLIKPWFGTGRTVIADSWFGSPNMINMLTELGLYSIMQVTKRRYWPRGMPVTDIVDQVEAPHGSCHELTSYRSIVRLVMRVIDNQEQ